MPNPVNSPNSALLDILDELRSLTNYYVGGILHLFKAPIAFSPNMVVADFMECDYSGYAPSSTVVFTAPFISPAGIPTLVGGLKQFQTTASPTVFNTVFGWYLTNTAGTKLLFFRTFDAPVALSLPNQGFSVIPAIPAYLGN